jgi:hypothetical protein
VLNDRHAKPCAPFIADMLRGRLDGVSGRRPRWICPASDDQALMTHGREGSEALAVIMRRVFDPLIEHVEEFGGFVAGFEGDAFHALFPAPAGDLREAARRAVAAGWGCSNGWRRISNKRRPRCDLSELALRWATQSEDSDFKQ